VSRTKVAGDWRRLHTEELHNLHASESIVKTLNQEG
jgi:hypothetical protein